MGSYSANNTVQQLSVWTQTPARRSTDNLESFLISRNYTEGLIVLCSPWKWNMLHWGLMVKDIACRSYIIERSWMSNQWEKMQQKQLNTSPQSSTESSPLPASRQRGTCVMWCTEVPEGSVHRQVLHLGVLSLKKKQPKNLRSLSSCRLLPLQGCLGGKKAAFLRQSHMKIMCLPSWNQLRRNIMLLLGEALLMRDVKVSCLPPPCPFFLLPAFFSSLRCGRGLQEEGRVARKQITWLCP